MEDNKNTVTEKPTTSNPTNIIVLTPDECTKLGLFKQVQVAIKNSPSSSQVTGSQPTIGNKSKTDGNTRDTLDEFGRKLAKALCQKLNHTQALSESPVVLSKYMTHTNRPRAKIKSITTTHKSIDPPEVITLDDDIDRSSSSTKVSYVTSMSSLLPSTESVFKSTREPLNDTLKKERVNVISSKSLNLSNSELKNLLSSSKPRNITQQPFLIPKEEVVLEDENLRASLVSNHLIKPEANDLSHEIQSKTITHTNKRFANRNNIKTPQRCTQESTDIEIISLEENQDEIVVSVNTKNRFNECKKEDNHEFAGNGEDHSIIEIKRVMEHAIKKDTDVQPSYQKMREKVGSISLKSKTQQSSVRKKQSIADLVKPHEQSYVNKVNTFKCYGKNKTITKTDESTEPMKTHKEKSPIKKRSTPKRKQNLDIEIVARKPKVEKQVVKVVATELTEKRKKLSARKVKQVERESSGITVASKFGSELKNPSRNQLRKNKFKRNGKDQSSLTTFTQDSEVVGQPEKSGSSSLGEKETKLKHNLSGPSIVQAFEMESQEKKPETILFSKESTISLVDLEPSFEIEAHAKLEANALKEIELEQNSKDQSSVAILNQSFEVETQTKRPKPKRFSKEDIIASVDNVGITSEVNTNLGKLKSSSKVDFEQNSKNQSSVSVQVFGSGIDAEHENTEKDNLRKKASEDLEQNINYQCSVSTLVSNSDIDAEHQTLESNTLKPKDSKKNNEKDQCSLRPVEQSFKVKAQIKKLQTKSFDKEDTPSVNNMESSFEIDTPENLEISALEEIKLEQNDKDQYTVTEVVSSSDISAKQDYLENNILNEKELVKNSRKGKSLITINDKINIDKPTDKSTFSNNESDWEDEPLINLISELGQKPVYDPEKKKKSRGRPRKILIVTVESSLEPKDSDSSNHPHLNRGRKTINYNENNDKELDDLIKKKGRFTSLPNISTNTSKKRGRPRNIPLPSSDITPKKLEIGALGEIKLGNDKTQSLVTELISSSDVDAKNDKLENNTLNEKELIKNSKQEKFSITTINDSELLTPDVKDIDKSSHKSTMSNNESHLGDEPLRSNFISKPVNKIVDEPEKKKKKWGRPRKIPLITDESSMEPKDADTSNHSHLKGRKTINYNQNNDKEIDDLTQTKGIFTSSHNRSANTCKKRGRPRNNPLLSSDITADKLQEEIRLVQNCIHQSVVSELVSSFNMDAKNENIEKNTLNEQELVENSEKEKISITTVNDREVLTYEVKDIDNSTHISKISNNESDLVDLVTKKTNKKPGRPRKIPIVTAASSMEPKDADTSHHSNLKRVRKSINYNENNDKELDELIKEKGICTPSHNTSISTNTTSKKRGRPRNNPLPQTPDLSPNPTPKKVGRPKRNSNEMTLTQSGSSDSEDKLQIESSMYGRKRKKVNYLRMDNPEKEKRRRKSSLVDSNVSEGGCSDASSNDREEAEIPSTILDGKEDKANDSTCIYRRTGATTKMLSTMLSTSIETDDVDIGSGPKVSLESVPKRGRPRGHQRRRRDSGQDIQYNSDGTVLCMICNQNINDTEWEYHKMKIHYNLAWRSGELPLDLHDEDFVYKNFVHLKKRNGKLKCHKCRAKHTNVHTFMDHLEICNGIVSSDGCVTCALCRAVLEKSQWQFHKLRYHNNLTWREGEKPLNLNDQTLVMAILNNIYKYRKPLHCEKCGIAKKSVVGYLSHKSICQKTEEELEQLKVTCELCGNKMMPVSMESHKKMAHSKKIEPMLDPNDLKVDSGTPTGQRKAAKKAMDIIDVFKTDGKVAMQAHNKYYIPQINFTEESFVNPILRTQMTEDGVKCKFKNCDYTDLSVKDLVEHMSKCEHKPPDYYCCRRCLLVSESESEMKDHFTEHHDVTVQFDEDFVASDEEEDEVLESNAKFLSAKMTNQKERHDKDASYKITPRCILQFTGRRDFRRIYDKTYIWTKEFCDEHYFKLKMFDKLFGIDPNWQIIDEELLDSYLPSVHRSCDVAEKTIKQEDNVENMDYEFRNLELFESTTNSNGNTSTLFCGGPISSMAWLPTPYTQLDCDQVLAVSVLKTSHKHYNIHDNYPEPSLIQFWNFGTLRNRDNLGLETAPKLMFGLAHNYGPIWHMEWCPSGCYQAEGEEKSNGTLGLLAVAGSVPAVPLFVVNRICDDGLFCTAKPVLELQLETENDYTLAKQKYYPTKISWSKASGHEYVAVGYSNGMVAIYNIMWESILLRKDKEGQMKLFPQKVFQAHISHITALSLSHFDGGNRWLMTASFDRESIIWNLFNMTKVSRSSKKTVVSDGVWMQHWMSCILSQCETDVGSLDNIPTSAKFIRNFLSESVPLLQTSSSIKSVSTSDWLNAIIQVSSAGDVLALFSHQLLTKIAGDKALRHARRLFGKTILVEKPAFKEEISEYSTSNPEYQKKAVTYEEAVEKYSILFLDYNLDDQDSFPRRRAMGVFSGNGGKLAEFKHDEYCLQSINKVAFNPNLQSATYYATGYEAGFVRITHMRYLRHNKQIV